MNILGANESQHFVMTPKPLLFRCALGLLALTLLAGCETTARKKSETLTEPFTVRKGTPAALLVEHLGEPDRKYPLADYSVEAMVWVYERRAGSTGKSVLTEIRTVPFYDITTGETVYMPEPVFNHQMAHNTEVTRILMVENRVVSWERDVTTDRRVDGQSR
ncbi:MAG: hypothetical protein SynsKO_39840 [Synoicihabitans sp.]